MANAFTERDNKRAAEWRRYFASAYSSFLTYEGAIEDCAKLLDEKLKEFADAGLLVDLKHWILCFAFDMSGVVTVRCNVSFGVACSSSELTSFDWGLEVLM
jgi:hypothetical protein